MQSGLGPHPYVADQNQEGYLRREWSQPHTRAPTGFQCQEDKYPGYKNQRELRLWNIEASGVSGSSF